jgi:hypothetical protein
MTMGHRGVLHWLRHVAMLLYCISLVLPAFDDWPGYMVLATGWLGLMFLFPSWLANPLFVTSYFTLPSRPQLAAWLALAAVLLAAAIPLFPGVPGDDSWERVKNWQMGTYFWVSSMALMFLTTFAEVVVGPKARLNQVEGR